MTGRLEDLAKHIEGLLGAKVARSSVAFGELTIVVAADGIVKASFELVFSPEEIEAAIKAAE